MDSKLRFQYGREGDILHIEKKPLPTRSNAPMRDDVVARLNPTTGEVENLEIMFFSTRRDLFEIPAMAELRLVPGV